MNDSEQAIKAALAPFGWTCGPDFWKRYHTDPWVFNLANAVERLTAQLASPEEEEDYWTLEVRKDGKSKEHWIPVKKKRKRRDQEP
jgi:hypothetical protein